MNISEKFMDGQSLHSLHQQTAYILEPKAIGVCPRSFI